METIPKHEIETAISDLGALFILIERKADKDPYICAMKQYIVNPLAYLHTERVIKKTEIAPPNLTSESSGQARLSLEDFSKCNELANRLSGAIECGGEMARSPLVKEVIDFLLTLTERACG